MVPVSMQAHTDLNCSSKSAVRAGAACFGLALLEAVAEVSSGTVSVLDLGPEDEGEHLSQVCCDLPPEGYALISRQFDCGHLASLMPWVCSSTCTGRDYGTQAAVKLAFVRNLRLNGLRAACDASPAHDCFGM